MLTRKQHVLLMYIDRHLRTTGFSPSFEEMKDALDLKSKSGIHRLISALEERGFLRRRRHRARALEIVRLPASGEEGAVFAPDVEEEAEVAPAGRVRRPAAHDPAAHDSAANDAATVSPAAAGFAPNVIRGDFTGRLPGVRAAQEAGAVELPLYGRIAAGLPIEALRDQGNHIEVPVAMVANGEHYALEVAGDSMLDAGILDGDTVIIRKGETAENGQVVVALVDEAEVTLKRLRRRGNSVALEPANARYEVQIFPADRVRVQGRLVALIRRY